jgi:hypothetical protein
MKKGQMFLIVSIITIIALMLLKTSLSLVKIIETKRYLEAGLERLEFQNIKDEAIKTIQISYTQENMTKNLVDYLKFAKSVLSMKAIDLNSILVETVHPNVTPNTSTMLNVTVLNLLGREIQNLTLTFSKEWWNASWSYRRNITIDNSANSNTLTNYQVFINVTYDSDMQSKFGDLRFTYYNSSSETETELSYWIEKNISSSYAEVWVKVPYIQASGYETVYMYYGNPYASTTSNGPETFDAFGSFEDGSWDEWTWENTTDTGWIAPSNLASYSGNGSMKIWSQYATAGQYTRFKKEVTLPMNGSVEFWEIGWGKLSNYKKISVWINDTRTDLIDISDLYNVSDNIWTNLSKKNFECGTCNISIGLYAYNSFGPYTTNHYSDAVKVRKYSSPEPTYEIGEEELPRGKTTFVSFPEASVIETNFMFSTSSDTNYTLTVFYKTEIGNSTEEILIPVEIGKSKFVGFLDLELVSPRLEQRDKFVETVVLNLTKYT